MKNRFYGFTLAEVLITLAIIGIVAALTIPTVVRNYQKQQTVVKLKKTYSALANTTNLAMAEYGPIETWKLGPNSNWSQSSIDFANTYVIPYLKVLKNCETKTTDDCAFNILNMDGGTNSLDSKYTRFYLNDGTLIGLVSDNYAVDGDKKEIARLYIDINGQKKPNKYGKDIFYFDYTIRDDTVPSNNGKMKPAGYTFSRNSLLSVCSESGTGIYCAALIMKDGWKISDDYPW
jgi:prepilin-type N-terminal cleavage/methylation domain-containing protein